MDATFSSLSSSSMSSVVRVFYEGNEYENHMKELDEKIRNYDRDIERMCNAHYQGFVDGIHELLQVRPQAHKLKMDILSTNGELIPRLPNSFLTTLTLRRQDHQAVESLREEPEGRCAE